MRDIIKPLIAEVAGVVEPALGHRRESRLTCFRDQVVSIIHPQSLKTW